MSRKLWLGVAVVVLGLAGAAGALVFKAGRRAEPLWLPRQAGFAAEPAPPETDAQAARALWEEALSQFQAAADDAQAWAETVPRLRRIWTRWPASEYAVRAQFFALASLAPRVPGTAAPLPAAEFVDRALKFPRAYCSERFEAGSQAIAARAIRQRLDDGQDLDAWRLCLRLRWVLPRLDLVAPACREVIAQHPEVLGKPENTLAELPATVARHALDPATLTPAAAAALRRYLADPFRAENLEALILALAATPYRSLALELAPELAGLGYEAAWRVESALGGSARMRGD